MPKRNRASDSVLPVDVLGAFREKLYASYTKRVDALFELTDAILTAGSVPSPPHLSLTSVHRRGQGSLYGALDRRRIDEKALRDLLAGQRLADDSGRARVYAVDRSSWPRCDAECSPKRGYLYHPSRQPIVAGWSYQLIAGLSFERDSWTTHKPDHRRLLALYRIQRLTSSPWENRYWRSPIGESTPNRQRLDFALETV